MSNLTIQNKDMWAAVKEQAELVKKAGLLPASMTAEQATIIALKGMELGIGTMRALEGMFVVNGKVAMDAKLVMGLIRERCPQAKIVVKKKDNSGCVIEATRPGQDPETFSFSIEDAKRAGLVKPNSPWEKYPSNMMWARTVTQMGRQLFSDILGSSYTPEELGGEHHEEEKPVQSVVRAEIAATSSGASQRVVDLNKKLTPDQAPVVSNTGFNEFKAKKEAQRANGHDKKIVQAAPIKEAKPVEVDAITGEVTGYPEMPSFDDFQNDEITGHKYDSFMIQKGVYTGKTLKELGIQTVSKMLVNTEASIARRKEKGDDVSEAMKTFGIIKDWLASNGVSQ